MMLLFRRPTLSLIVLLVSASVAKANVPDSFWENYCVSALTLEEKEKWSCHMGTGAAWGNRGEKPGGRNPLISLNKFKQINGIRPPAKTFSTESIDFSHCS